VIGVGRHGPLTPGRALSLYLSLVGAVRPRPDPGPSALALAMRRVISRRQVASD